MNIDLFSTCLELAGLSLPADRIIDGRSLVPLLTRPGSPSPHERLFFYHQGELEGVREGKWKYFRSVNHYVWPMPVTREGRRASTPRAPLLFNLETDLTVVRPLGTTSRGGEEARRRDDAVGGGDEDQPRGREAVGRFEGALPESELRVPASPWRAARAATG
jgi:arylsulfatase A-like enzyme